MKSGDEWGDPSVCEAGDACQYCHTRTEQQFHPEIYKSTKCNDIQNTSYCPRGAFCAFAHVERKFREFFLQILRAVLKTLFFAEETVSLESPPAENGGHNLSEIISGVLPGDQSSEDSKRLFAQRGVHGPLRNGSLTVRKPTNLGPFLVTFWAFIKSIS